MKSAIVLPTHDPAGLELPFLWQIEPDLKQLFTCAFVGLSDATRQQQSQAVERLQTDPFYHLAFFAPGSLPGEHYRAVFALAVGRSPTGRLLHLCNLDRVAFALLSDHRQEFLNSLKLADAVGQPILFQRSAQAWSTHPYNYRQVEGLVIQVGELLFGEYYDFAWSHLALPAGLLGRVLEQVQSRDFGLLIEMVLLLRQQLQPQGLIRQEVDWLAWEDPFVLGRDPVELKAERESSRQETIKRLRGVLPFFDHFLRRVPELGGTLQWEKKI